MRLSFDLLTQLLRILEIYQLKAIGLQDGLGHFVAV